METRRLAADRRSEPGKYAALPRPADSNSSFSNERFALAIYPGRKSILRNQYLHLMQTKLQRILYPEELSANSIDDRAFLKYVYGEKGRPTKEETQQSVSFQAAVDENSARDINMSEVLAQEDLNGGLRRKKQLLIGTKKKKERCIPANANTPDCSCAHGEGKDEDDDMARLGKLSLINMGARYELLNANKMLLDFDISMRVSVRARTR